ncbi:hypothetical protein VMY22_23 [Bacillus phage VMY22]|uniref:Uncharacterized protein n=1 Tax=Bacillus phage VMY22 TaxID=1734382 RepID=A0A0N9SHS9_9CAUD|nr:hypothetical protein VMY22_23 [Bacillus phage VMY22]ALH46488.1 hypothetical protein VMY22_23 [Bacillus phage VMY22]
MKTITLLKALTLTKKYRDDGYLSNHQALQISQLFEQAYKESKEGEYNEQIQKSS